MARPYTLESKEVYVALYELQRYIRTRGHRDIFYLKTKELGETRQLRSQVSRGIGVLIHLAGGNFHLNGFCFTSYANPTNRKVYKAERIEQ
jgi:hypothetical protein